MKEARVMPAGGSLTEYVDRYRGDPEYQVQQVLLGLNEAIVEYMEAQGLRPSDLAERLGVSRPYVTKLLEGNENLTLKSLVKVANALCAEVDVRLSPRGSVRVNGSRRERGTKTGGRSRRHDDKKD